MSLTNINIKEFINYIITFDNIDDILNTYKTESNKGFIFERLWDIIIKFGFCNNFPNSNFNHLIGNSNNGKLKILKNFNKYLNEKIISGNSSGCSDITLQNKNDNTFIFISSKYPKTTEDIKKQKSVNYYDIQNIIAMATKNNNIYINYKIYLVVPNKKKVLDKVKTANISSQYITEHITENNILDKDDLNKFFLEFKQDIIKNKNNDWNKIYLSAKEKLKLRFHQELITEKTNTLIEEGNKNSNTYNVSIQFKMSLQSLIDNPKELLELINDCLKPKEVEKKENGEVFTPIVLVNEMLDKLPKDIWKNKNIKWFDPATGMGNFPIAVYLRLMETLPITDVKERKKHILENMLYMCELNKKNVLVCNQIFDINNEYKLNLYQGDTLEFNPFEIFKVKQFDIILGNPPYNKGGIRSHTGKQLGEKNETIWTKFIEKGFQWLKADGYLLFINPLSWLKKSHSLHNIMLEKHIIWMKLWDNIKSLATINGKIPISLFVLQNKLNTDENKTEIISEIQSKKLITTSNEYLNPKYSIPLAYHSIFNKLINFIETKNLKLEYKTKTIKSTGIKTKIPLKYKLNDMLAIDTYTIKEGIMIKKATEIHPDLDKRKLIIANKASFNGAFIDDGKLSLTGNHKFYILGDNLELIIKMLEYKIIDIISHYTKYGQDFLDNEAFTFIPDIRKLKIKDIDENKFYKLIGLTNDEIKLFDKNYSK